MISQRLDYESLGREYDDPGALVNKKIRIVGSRIGPAGALLDVGAGTGAFITLVKDRFREISAIDVDPESCRLLRERFRNDGHIRVAQGSIDDLADEAGGAYDCVTCLDVLEHVDVDTCRRYLSAIHGLLASEGTLVFSGPGVFEKVRIRLGRSPFHLHSHSSYGWMKMIRDAGFAIASVETAEFPLMNSDLLRKKFHLLGKCCIIVAKKIP